MRSTFLGLSVTSSALAAQRRAIETAGHNVANANTEGYTRQRVELGAINGGAVSVHSGVSSWGNGVDVLGQNRIIDQFLVNRSNTETAVLGMHTERQQTLNRLELSFGEPGENGLESQLEAFWGAWDTVSLSPEDEAARAALLQRGASITDQFRSLTQQFDRMSEDVLQRADAMTVDINGISQSIADLNVAIAAATAAGAPPNDLLDQRDVLVRKLSDYVGVTTRVDDLGRMSVNIGGASLVAGNRANTVSLDTSVPGAAVLRISTSSTPLQPTSGRMQGLLESANVLIPGQQAQLDALAVQLRDVVNGQHVLGQDLDGNPGVAFFGGTSARDFGVAAGVAGQPRRIAAALLGDGAFSGNNAVRMAELAGLHGGPDDIYRAMIARMGVDAQSAGRQVSLQSELSRQVDAQRDAVQGVSIDEEMAMLVAYQQSYDASARVMTAIDEMIDRLINGTGMVGR